MKIKYNLFLDIFLSLNFKNILIDIKNKFNYFSILLNYYENSNEEKFEEIKKKTKAFLDNYNNIDDKDKTIELLIKEYEETTTIDFTTNNSKEKYRIIAISIFIDIIILLAVLIKRRCKK